MQKIKKIALLLAVMFIFALPAQAASGVIQFQASDVGVSDAGFAGGNQPAAAAPAPQQEELVIPTATLSPEAAALPWYLTLVNRTHPVPDGWTVELKTLSNGEQVDMRIYPDLQAMFDACRAAGLTPQVNTSYRTYDDQKRMLVTKYRQQRDKGLSHEDAQIAALKWASYPGYSEHQLGLAIDINSSDQERCSNDEVWTWMKYNCQDYGFIWRYPGVKSDITGISNEDWHFRYVGREAAQYIMSNQICLEEYLEQQYGIK